jgi:selenocysteine-specific elongation factor
VIIGTAGHIDHGKTALVRALTGVNTDRLPEEQRRGITIELGFAPLVLEGLETIGVVDVPGHEAFVRTMLAGATGIDVALLVVAADEGVMPQTREHLSILSLLGVRAGVIAITKRDLVDDEWLALVRDDIAQLVRGSPLEDAPTIETSATTGEGIEALRAAIRQVMFTLPLRDRDDLFRMPIDRAFTVRGTGTVVTGTVWSGSLTADTPLRLFPADRVVRVRGLQSHGDTTGQVGPGTRAAVALSGTDVAEAARGGLLVQEGGWRASTILRADVALLDDVEHPLRPREWVRLHLGTTEVGARVVASGGAIEVGQRRGARVVLDAPVVARAGDRFVLRRPSPLATIGGGVVVDPSPARRRARAWPVGISSPAARLDRLLEEGGHDGIEIASIPVRVGIAPSAVMALLDGTGATIRIGDRVYSRATVEGVALGVKAAVDAFHDDQHLEIVAPMAYLRTQLAVGDRLLEAAVVMGESRGEIERAPGGVRRPGWTPRLSDRDAVGKKWLEQRLKDSGAEPPSVSELQHERGNDPIPLLRILAREGLVVQVEPERYYSASIVQELLARLGRGMEPGKVYSPGELKDLLGTSRKFLIPFLEYCDRQRFTERREQGRVWARD